MFAFLRIERPTNATLRPQSTATSAACCIRCTFEAKDETRMRPSRLGKIWRNASPTTRSDSVTPGALRVRRVAEQEVDAATADLGETADVCALPVDRCVVELVVAGVDAAPARRLQHDRSRVGNRVRHPHELDAERAELDRPVARHQLLQLGDAQQAVLVELRLHERERQPRREDERHAHLAHQVRKGADVILVPVREHDRSHHLLPIPQVPEVGKDEIDTEMLVSREGEPGVDHDDRSVRLVDGHVLADLAEAPERDDAARAHER